MWVLLGIILIGLFLAVTMGSAARIIRSIVFAILFLAIGFGFLYFYSLPKKWKQLFAQQKLLHDEMKYVISDDGIHATTPMGEGRLPWDTIIKWRENKDLFALYQSDVVLHIIPKRSFASEDDVSQFVEMLKKHVGEAA